MRNFRLALLVAALLGISTLPARAQNMYVDFNGAIPGTSTETNHMNWIVGYSFAHGESLDCVFGGTGGSCSGLNLTEVTLTKQLDKSSPLLFAAGTQATVYPTVRIDVCYYDGTLNQNLCPYQLTLNDVFVSGASVNGDGCLGGCGSASESISLAFTKISWKFVEFDASGKPGTTICRYWDRALIKGGSC